MSGAHVNPAVTVGMLATGKTAVVRGLLYIIAQCVGAIIGTGLVKVGSTACLLLLLRLLALLEEGVAGPVTSSLALAITLSHCPVIK